MFSKILLTLILTSTLVSSNINEDESYSSPVGSNEKPASSTVGFEVNKGYQVSAHLDGKGRPSGHLSLFGTGKLGPGGHYQQQQPLQQYYSNPESLPPASPYYLQQIGGTSLLSGHTGTFLTAAAYFIGGIVAAASVWYTCSIFSGSKKSIEDLEDLKKDEKVKSRRRRAIEVDDKLNNLVSMVLAAIESGECLQKSICLMGSQVGTGRGRLAATFLNKMVPETIQGSPYFVTFRNALNGNEYCNKFHCKH